MRTIMQSMVKNQIEFAGMGSNFSDQLKATHPVITDTSIYNSNNIFIQSDNFAADLYPGSIPGEVIRVTCKMSSSQIPTEEEAVQHVRDMRTEKVLFTRAVEAVIGGWND